LLAAAASAETLTTPFRRAKLRQGRVQALVSDGAGAFQAVLVLVPGSNGDGD
jgi:hypothetical protein